MSLLLKLTEYPPPPTHTTSPSPITQPGGAIATVTLCLSAQKKNLLVKRRPSTAAILGYYHGETSPDVSPPADRDNAPPSPRKTVFPEVVPASNTRSAAERGTSGGGGHAKTASKKQPQPRQSEVADRRKPRSGSTGTRPLQHDRALPVIERYEDGANRRHSKHAVPPGMAVVEPARGPPPPCDESYFSDNPRSSLSRAESGSINRSSFNRKKARWSGGRDAKAFLGSGTYDMMANDDEIINHRLAGLRGVAVGREEASDNDIASQHSKGGSNRIVSALRNVGNKPSDGSGKVPDWVDPSTSNFITIGDIPIDSKGVLLDNLDLPVAPPPPPDVDAPVPVPARITSAASERPRNGSHGYRCSSKKSHREKRVTNGHHDHDQRSASRLPKSLSTSKRRSLRAVAPSDDDEEDIVGVVPRTGWYANAPTAQAPPPPSYDPNAGASNRRRHEYPEEASTQEAGRHRRGRSRANRADPSHEVGDHADETHMNQFLTQPKERESHRRGRTGDRHQAVSNERTRSASNHRRKDSGRGREQDQNRGRSEGRRRRPVDEDHEEISARDAAVIMKASGAGKDRIRARLELNRQRSLSRVARGRKLLETADATDADDRPADGVTRRGSSASGASRRVPGDEEERGGDRRRGDRGNGRDTGRIREEDGRRSGSTSRRRGQSVEDTRDRHRTYHEADVGDDGRRSSGRTDDGRRRHAHKGDPQRGHLERHERRKSHGRRDLHELLDSESIRIQNEKRQRHMTGEHRARP